MKHAKAISKQPMLCPRPAYVPFEDISWGDVISWMPEYVFGLFQAIINIYIGLNARKEASV